MRACSTLRPPPRKHRHRYHGVFAPNHKLRSAVTALAIGNIGRQREAVTGGMTDDVMDREFALILRLQLEMIEPGLNPPPYDVALGALQLRRAAHWLVKRRSLREALHLAGGVRDPRAWGLAVKIVLGIAVPKQSRRPA